MARVSKVQKTKDGFEFGAEADYFKRFVFETKKEATRTRAKVIRALKYRGDVVLCQ